MRGGPPQLVAPEILCGLEVVAAGVCVGHQGRADSEGGVDLRLGAGRADGGDLGGRGGASTGRNRF